MLLKTELCLCKGTVIISRAVYSEDVYSEDVYLKCVLIV